MTSPSLQTSKPIFRLLILICFLPLIPAISYINDLNHSNSHHIAYSTLKHYQEYVYKFDGHFRPDRLAQLKVITDEGGSLQSIDCLQYEELKYIINLKSREWHKYAAPFIDAHDRLVKKLDHFAGGFSQMLEREMNWVKRRLEKEAADEPIHDVITGYFSDENLTKFPPDMTMEQIVKNLLDHVKKKQPAHGFVMSCKLFMFEVFSEGGEATWLDVFTFMDQKDNVKDYRMFRKIFDTATVQTAELDQIANLMIFKRHLDAAKEAKSKGKSYNEGIVVGAGPIGLYTAIQFFMAGMRIFLVNNRQERYVRKQITFLDPKWTVQLRFLLGTRFNTLFMDKGARGQITHGETGKVSILALEIELKARLVDLVTLVHFFEQNVNLFNINIHHRLDMLYEAAFDGIYGLSKLTNGQLIWLANFETPQIVNNRDGTKFRANLMKIKSKKYEQEGLDGWEALAKAKKEIAEENVEVEGAKAQLGGKKIATKKLPNIPFDFLVCAGGANDQMRNKYLGNPESLIPERNYGVGMVDKVDWDEPIFEDLAVFIDVVSMQKEMADAVKRQKFSKTIAFSDISENLIIKYSNLEHMLLTQEDPKRKQVIRIWESRPSIHIAASTPPALEQFIKDLDAVSKQEKEWAMMDLKTQDEIDSKIDKIDKIYRGFREVLERKWFLAVFDYALSIKHRRKTRIEKAEKCASKFKPIKQQNILLNAFDRMPEDDGGIEEEDVAQQWARQVEKKCPQAPKMLRLYFAEFNVSTFALRIQAAQESVKSFKDVMEVRNEDMVDRHGKPIPPPPGLVIALGDANASPHFLTASGLSTGRLGVEHVAILIRNYHLGLIDDSELIKQIGNKLDLVKKQVHRKAQEFEALVSQIVKS